METAIIAIVAFVPMLVMLVVIHEWGHFFTARTFGVKVLEFGIGYPPRAFAFYTGRTRVLLDADTQLVNLAGPDELRPGLKVCIYSAEDDNGNLVARIVEDPASGGGRRQSSLHDMGRDEYLRHEGTVREADAGSLVVADMAYTINWLPLGGFVRLAGENNPAVPRSLASKGPGPRTIILAAGSLVNAAFPLVAFTLLFMIPQSVTVGQVQVDVVEANSPAQAAGLQPGDLVLVAGDRTIEQGSDLVRATMLNAGEPMEWTIQRDGITEVIRLTPRVDPPPGQGATGIQISLVNLRSETRFDPPWTAVWRGATSSWEMLTLLRQEISSWITGVRSPQLIRAGGDSPGYGRSYPGRGPAGVGGAVHPLQHQLGHPQPAAHTHAGRRADNVRAAGVDTGRAAHPGGKGRPGSPHRLRCPSGLHPLHHLQRHSAAGAGREFAGGVNSFIHE